MNFIGNTDAINTIKLLVNPTFLCLYGTRCVGKYTLAIEWIRYKECLEKSELFSDCSCKSCTLIKKDSHQDIKVFNLTKDTSAAGPLREQVEKFLEDTSHNPVLAKRRYYIINFDIPPNSKLQNMLLKRLEEPYSYVTFIFIAPTLNYFLPTVESRATLIPFVPFNPDDRIHRIESMLECSNQDAKKIATYVGRLDLLEGIDLPELMKLIDSIKNILEVQQPLNYYQGSKLAELVNKYPFLATKIAIEYLSRWLILHNKGKLDSPLFKEWGVTGVCYMIHDLLASMETSSWYHANKQLYFENLLMNSGSLVEEGATT